MDQIINILKTYQETDSIKSTASRCKVSKNTVKAYLRSADAHDADLSVVLKLPAEKLRQLFYANEVSAMVDRKANFDAKVDYWLKELKRVGVNKQLLYQEYKEEHPDGYKSTQFYDHLRREIGRRDLTIALNHKPGEKLQVDFAGSTFPWVDRETGEVHKAQVLVGVMPLSQHTFAIALPSQCIADFVHGLNKMLRFFGGVPKVILSDNLKSFVIKADRYDPDFNDTCVQLAAHYQLDIEAARVRKPRDKASVENSVRTAYTRLYAPLRNQVFHSLAEVNAGLRQQLRIHQDLDFQKREGTRLSCFTEHELPMLSPLPTTPFLLKKTVRAKVQKNYHVFLGECKNYYSVPFQHVGDRATVVYSRDTVEIFVGPIRIATHARLPTGARYHYQTDPAHLPREHAEWLKTEGYDAAYFRAWGRRIGPATEWAIGQILLTKIHQPQSYRSCLGTLALAKKYGDDRLENAAIRCQIADKATYCMLRNILTKGLDQQSQQPDLFTPPEHENIRGPAAYQ